MKKISSSLIAGLLLSLFVNSEAKAGPTDARSVALGGTTMGLDHNGAFTPMRNPAGMVNIGWGAFLLPFSHSVQVGNTLGSFSSFIPGSNQQEYLNKILSSLSGSNGLIRAEVDLNHPLFGFSGAPFSDLKLVEKPLAFGLNIWANGNVQGQLNFSQGLNDLVSIAPVLAESSQTVSKISTDFSAITSIKLPDISKLTDFTNPNLFGEAVQEVETFQKDTLKPLINTTDSALKSFENLNKAVSDFLSNVEILSKEKQRIAGDVVADGHAVIAFSGAGQIFHNDLIDLSAGVNLKGFFFPANSQITNPLKQFNIGPEKSNLLPLTAKVDVELGPFESLGQVKKILDEQIKPVLEDAKDIVDDAKVLDGQLDTAIPKAKANGIIGVITDIPSLTSTATSLQTEANSITAKVSGLNNAGNQIRESLAKDISTVKINLSQVQDVSPLGLGVDLGLQAKIMENLNIGLMLENPLVIWPAKQRTDSATIDPSFLQGGNNINFSKLLKINPEAKNENINYTLSEPFAIRFGGGYKLDSLGSFLSNTTILADVEQVFNGRPLAVHFGLEKGWSFSGGGFSGRLGTQLGGIGNLFTLGFGGKIGPVLIDLGYGASNPFDPVGSKSALASLSTSLIF